MPRMNKLFNWIAYIYHVDLFNYFLIRKWYYPFMKEISRISSIETLLWASQGLICQQTKQGKIQPTVTPFNLCDWFAAPVENLKHHKQRKHQWKDFDEKRKISYNKIFPNCDCSLLSENCNKPKKWMSKTWKCFRGMLGGVLLFLVGGARAHVSLLWPPGDPSQLGYSVDVPCNTVFTPPSFVSDIPEKMYPPPKLFLSFSLIRGSS